MKEPQFLKSHMSQALQLLKEGWVREIIFSGSTYQIGVQDPAFEELFWPFIRLDSNGEIADAFCNCASSSDGGCVHLAAAFLRIYNFSKMPLHERFSRSLFYALCLISARRFGFSSEDFVQSRVKLKASSPGIQEELDHIFKVRAVETEETSLKFSNLTEEEIAAWRAGRASFKLEFELSFWSDLAKLLFLHLDNGESYKVSFRAEGRQLPYAIEIAFSDFSALFFVQKEDWPRLIYALKSLKCPLKVFENGGALIERAEYNPQKMEFILLKDRPQERPPADDHVGGWAYVASQGFYPTKEHALLQKEKITKEEIDQTLSDYASLLKKISNVPIIDEPIEGQYELFFDAESNLHLRRMCFEKGDLERECSYYFGNWAYVAGKGFYRLLPGIFEGAEKVVLQKDVADFVDCHTAFLHGFEGFTPYFSNLHSYLVYSFLENGALRFDSELELPDEFENYIDFSRWLYLKGRGFFLKEKSKDVILSPGMEVPRASVGAFVLAHKEDLEQVKNFFLDTCPIKAAGLHIGLSDGGQIELSPKIVPENNIAVEDLTLFDGAVFRKNKGFYILPPSMRLPKGYETLRIVPSDKESTFINFELDSLLPFVIEQDRRLKRPERLVLRARRILRQKKKSFNFWLMDLVYESECGSVSAVRLWEAMQEKRKYLFSDAGLLFLKDFRFNWLSRLNKRRRQKRQDLLRMNTFEWFALSMFEDVLPPTSDMPGARATSRFMEQLSTFAVKKDIDISALQAVLRPYQETGLRWLYFMYVNGLSGLLCDEMGLGKTHQAMALIAATLPENPGKYLVVCPTSVIYHWEELLSRFLPKLRVCTYHGGSRSLHNFSAKYDLLLTSYGILRIGDKSIGKLNFEIAIFDEVHVAKNHTSQTHKALKQIKAVMRLGMTGTPIENYIRELKALFDLVMPAYLPKDAVFKEQFLVPIEKEGSVAKKELLKRIVKPFILRRKKSEVLLDLPEKIEEISYCDLSLCQKNLYKEVFGFAKDAVLQDLQEPGRPVSYMHIFAVLSKLKQICDHPAIYLKEPQNYQNFESGKWNLFVDLVNETRESGQKLVIFSQYLDMLSIIESYLKKRKIKFASIKGATKHREAQLKKFQGDPECEVFVASLLAAGVGIDLSSASVVIHYDRWWNPAKENQATDRVHRIGQNRGVQVFKLVTKHSIEERIHEIISAKQHLIDETIGTDDSETLKSFSREELLYIFRKLGDDIK